MKKTLNILKIIPRYIPILIYIYILRPFHVILYKCNKLRFFKKCSINTKFIFRYLGVKLSVSGKDLLPGPEVEYLIVANHQSFVDVPIMLSIIPCAFIQRPVSYIPGFSWYFGKLSLVIDQEHPVSIIRIIRYVKKIISCPGVPVSFFPEGTRSRKGELNDLNLGAATTAKILALPIIPVVLYNTWEILSRGIVNPKKGVVHIAIQPEIKQEFVKNHSVEDITIEIKRKLQEGMDVSEKKQRKTRGLS